MILINRSSMRMPRQFLLKWEKTWRQKLSRNGLVAPSEVTLIFVNPAEMKRINRNFRKKNYATDVLSFLMTENEGEIVVCPQVVKSNSQQADLARMVMHDPKAWGFNAELALMLLHGLLHLSGHDHSPHARLTEPMIALQNSIFQSGWISRARRG